MDKVRLLNRISALSPVFYAGQHMRESRMDRGQEFGRCQKPGFCTVDAVDMQGLVHRTLALRSWLSGVDAGWQSRFATYFCVCVLFFWKTRLERCSVELLAKDVQRASYPVCLLKSLYTK